MESKKEQVKVLRKPKKLKIKIKLVDSKEPTVEEPTVEEPTVDKSTSDESTNKKYIELENRELLKHLDEYDFLYPSLDDPNFNIKISERKEFNDTKYEGVRKDTTIEEEADRLCNAQFELAPHQLFVRNFMSFQTPYNGLLLYHGLGSGKTCSAISIAEEMRDYLKQMGLTQRIIVVASPNVQENFKLQLFDETKLQLIDGLWNIRACTGNKFLKEINPMSMKGLTKEKVTSQIKRIINTSYLFLGYIEFANYISKISQVDSDIASTKRKEIMKNKLRKNFSNRLIIIDEVHNIRISDDNKDKRVAVELMKLVENVQNMRLLLLSATPMYNSYKEIIWIINLLNLNDRRPTIEVKDVFDSDGGFKIDEEGNEKGKELLIRKSTGYVSFVRGENPYTFPFRLWPHEFSPENSFNNSKIIKPSIQVNGRPIIQPLEMLSLYLVHLGEYQETVYNYIIQKLKRGEFGSGDRKMPTFENMEAFGYTLLQRPIESLNIAYPIDEIELLEEDAGGNIDVKELVGKAGLSRIMKYTETASPMFRGDFEYKTDKWGRIFSIDQIGKYSGKIKKICEKILNSTGVVLIYSQYIDGGLVPLALALEELGFTRTKPNKSLFKTPPREQIDAIHFKTKSELNKDETFNPAKYAMITGDKALSPDNVNELKLITSLDNKYGEKVKVVMISQAGSEGLDFKFIRQVHVLEPWYNMNRIEQIIGRAVRTCSHKNLPFKQRNVEIHLYGSLMSNPVEEAVDLYVYRLAELKSIQIGNVTRVLKEISVDCLLNYQQLGFTKENMNTIVKQELTNKTIIDYAVGDKPYSSTCDYKERCSYTCNPFKLIQDEDIKMDSYNESFINSNNDKIIFHIKELFKERFFYNKHDLVIQITMKKSYPLIQINAALHQLVEDKNEYITDVFGRLGRLVNIGDLYLFQPLELNNKHITSFERKVPIDYKRKSLEYPLPKEITEAVIEIKDRPLDENVEGMKVLNSIKDKFSIAMTPQQLESGIDDWYVYCSITIPHLVEKGMNIELIKDLLIEHILEELLFSDSVHLLNILDTLKSDEITKRIKKYYENKFLKYKSLIGIITIKEGKQSLVVKDEKDDGTSYWRNAEQQDYEDLKEEIADKITDRLLPVRDKLNDYIGFMAMFKKEYMVYKVKNMKKLRHKGARCDQSQKKEAITILNKIIGNEEYELNTQKTRNEVCIIQEFTLRQYEKERKNDKVWFLTPAEAVLINIESLHF
jgi:hypothetical protein